MVNFAEFYIRISEMLNINSSRQLTKLITEEFIIDINILLNSKDQDKRLEAKKSFLTNNLNDVCFRSSDLVDGELDRAANPDFVYNKHQQ